MYERSSPVLTAAQTASRLGVTVKALRVFERHGLVKPGRTAAGWRVYGAIELARLHQVLVLRQLGLPLAGIARLLSGLAHELDHTLALQEEVLAGQLSSVRQALDYVRSARQRVARGESLSVEDLIDLMQETTMTERQPTPEMQTLIDKHYTPEQLEQLKARPFTAADQERVSAAWADIYDKAQELVGTDPGAPAAQELARRANTLIAEFTGGDPGIAASLQSLWQEGSMNHSVTAQMPGTPSARSFLAKAQERLVQG